MHSSLDTFDELYSLLKLRRPLSLSRREVTFLYQVGCFGGSEKWSYPKFIWKVEQRIGQWIQMLLMNEQKKSREALRSGA
jgi:hypothetical protein